MAWYRLTLLDERVDALFELVQQQAEMLRRKRTDLDLLRLQMAGIQERDAGGPTLVDPTG